MNSDRIFLYPGAGPGGKEYLRQLGTREGISRLGVELIEGQTLRFYCDDADDKSAPSDLLFEGVVHFDPTRREWYVIIDEKSYRQASDEAKR